MNFLSGILTIARWEVRKSVGTMGKDVLPLAVLLFIILVAVTGNTAQSGLHLQDNLYSVGVDDPSLVGVIGSDSRFVIYEGSPVSLYQNRESFDVIIIRGDVFAPDTKKGRAAVKTLQRDYDSYINIIYSQQEDLFASYPLWIDVQNVKSELDFVATQSGSRVAAPARSSTPPVPEGPVIEIVPPSSEVGIPLEDLRQGLVESQGTDSQISRYTDMFGEESPFGTFKTPHQLSPPLPFDSIILIFVFIFPLYFTSQFFMMSIMNERLERRGEVLLSTPLRPWVIIAGKALPYCAGMVAITLILSLWVGESVSILLPIIPVILFFLASALIIGMISRSFKELSFISIFFSTVATSYLFFPTIFANVHIISLISPLTLVIFTIQGEAFTISQYFYSTALFFLTSIVLFYIGITNFREERLFSHARLLTRISDFIATGLSLRHPYLSIFIVTVLAIPFVFMVQMMLLVLFFNLPMPLSLILLIVSAAFVEEVAKSVGIFTLLSRKQKFLGWGRIIIISAVTAAAFLFGEKLLLLVTLSQITESVFGNILFLSLGVLWIPFLLHFVTVLIVAVSLRLKGTAGYVPGLIVASIVHCIYNLYFILGWFA
ncbi:MAG TPA: PrsW family intramembrane metalloprotease [Methanoregulaceae archaeon]|nr:PrsW family intramembrane metalloprotease [Methanoregulaceae archaeon]